MKENDTVGGENDENRWVDEQFSFKDPKQTCLSVFSDNICLKAVSELPRN